MLAVGEVRGADVREVGGRQQELVRLAVRVLVRVVDADQQLCASRTTSVSGMHPGPLIFVGMHDVPWCRRR